MPLLELASGVSQSQRRFDRIAPTVLALAGIALGGFFANQLTHIPSVCRTVYNPLCRGVNGAPRPSRSQTPPSLAHAPTGHGLNSGGATHVSYIRTGVESAVEVGSHSLAPDCNSPRFLSARCGPLQEWDNRAGRILGVFKVAVPTILVRLAGT
jgi:hypothetical protein